MTDYVSSLEEANRSSLTVNRRTAEYEVVISFAPRNVSGLVVTVGRKGIGGGDGVM
jgi:hypothetical protein